MAPSTGEASAMTTSAEGVDGREALRRPALHHSRSGHLHEVDRKDRDHDRGLHGGRGPVVHGPGAQLGAVEPEPGKETMVVGRGGYASAAVRRSESPTAARQDQAR